MSNRIVAGGHGGPNRTGGARGRSVLLPVVVAVGGRGAAGDGVDSPSNLAGATKATFDGRAGVIISDTATKITVKVPAKATTGVIQVVTPDRKAKSATVFSVT